MHSAERYDLYSSPDIIYVTKMEKNEVGGACGMYEGEERCLQGSGGET
jgi:hypothetical protein